MPFVLATKTSSFPVAQFVQWPASHQPASFSVCDVGCKRALKIYNSYLRILSYFSAIHFAAHSLLSFSLAIWFSSKLKCNFFSRSFICSVVCCVVFEWIREDVSSMSAMSLSNERWWAKRCWRYIPILFVQNSICEIETDTECTFEKRRGLAKWSIGCRFEWFMCTHFLATDV